MLRHLLATLTVMGSIRIACMQKNQSIMHLCSRMHRRWMAVNDQKLAVRRASSQSRSPHDVRALTVRR